MVARGLTVAARAEIFARAQQVEPDHAGGNSTVRRVVLGGESFAVKDYSSRADGAKRMSREWAATRYLAACGQPGFALPVALDPPSNRAAYTWIAGEHPRHDSQLVSRMVDLLRDLHQTANAAVPSEMPFAEDAAWTPRHVLAQIESRLDRLVASPDPKVSAVAKDAIAPAARVCHSEASDRGTPVLTLSPSDFGAHNLLWDATTGTMSCIDLEFFGWDDATKLVCDTLLHPQARWTDQTASRFRATAVELYGLDENRVANYLPLYALKWATIVLARAERELLAAPPGEVDAERVVEALVLTYRYLGKAQAC